MMTGPRYAAQFNSHPKQCKTFALGHCCQGLSSCIWKTYGCTKNYGKGVGQISIGLSCCGVFVVCPQSASEFRGRFEEATTFKHQDS